ncbi:MAG TPA: hypothetical protein DCY30_03010 [Acidimicrobiaceae bacterium]|nr:hypothetical protein [Acidimicrobiaceae bacterium]|tara:strand:+ start:142 stop:1302 length:1161 start_codon:yes stop_codon:yes gene_type:complete
MDLPSYDDLDESQDAVLFLPLEGNWLITGPPGTGKSVMSLFRLQRMNNQGNQTELLVYNRMLRRWLGNAVEYLNIGGKAFTYHAWFLAFWKKCGFEEGVPHKEGNRYNYDFKEIKKRIDQELGEESIKKVSTPFLIVDEGQDLPPDLYFVAALISRHLTIFADENQSIKNTDKSTIDDIRMNAMITEEFKLSRNYRNSKQIAELARELFPGSEDELPDLPKREGEEPQIQIFDRPNSKAGVSAQQDRIITEAINNSGDRIGIFLPRVGMVERWGEKLEQELSPKGIKVYTYYSKLPNEEKENINFTEPGVFIAHWRNAKGLEFDTVFCPQMQNKGWPDPSNSGEGKHIYYVLVSRARTKLYFQYYGDETPTVFNRFPEDGIEWRDL